MGHRGLATVQWITEIPDRLQWHKRQGQVLASTQFWPEDKNETFRSGYNP
jgi:hypothetical protein